VSDTIDLRYPVGRFTYTRGLTQEQRQALIRQIAAAPGALRAATNGLRDAQLDTPYRPDGWTVRQVVHHVPDSHMNAYIRFKLALTEDKPTIKPYDEAAWAKVADTALTPIDVSLTLLDALHHRWVLLLESLEPSDYSRELVHPDHGPVTLHWMLQLYAWHGRHHTAHVTELRKREEWG
jgi:DinB superfamily